MYIKICPNCGSTDVKLPPRGGDMLMTVRDYCERCGNMGLFPEVDEEETEEFRKKLKK